MLSALRYCWKLILRVIGFGPKPWTAEVVEDPPDRPDPERIYLVGDEDTYWCAVFACPCGCGEVINLNLLPQTRPCWHIQVDGDKKITLTPSVWRKMGCQSHFFLRGSSIQWCEVQEPTVRI